MLVYKSTGETGFYEYARREDGVWFGRYVPLTREGGTAKPGPWKRAVEPAVGDLPTADPTPEPQKPGEASWYVPLPPGE